MKIVNIKEKTFISLERFEDFNKLSGRMWLLIILKITKKQGFSFSLEDIFLEKLQEWVSN